MAHPPDQALARAITAILREARSRGMTHRDLAEWFGVSEPTVSRWEAGGRQPALDLLPRFDELARQPRGYVLRRAGYVIDNSGEITATTRYDVNFDDPDERDLWKLDHIPEAKRWQLILQLRKDEKPPLPPSRQPRRTTAKKRRAS